MSFSEQDLEEFKTEALELLEVAEKALLAIDQGAEFRTSFDAVFRSFHNLKGSAGMMELSRLQSHMHELETIFMIFKAGSSIPKQHISLFLRGVDAARFILEGQAISFIYKVASPSEPMMVPQTIVVPPKPVLDSAVEEFVAECEEMIERVSKNLQLIEKKESTKDSIDALYRDVHSLKGSAYLFSYNKIGDISHAMESSLEKIRKGTHRASKMMLNQLFKSLEVIESLVKKARAQASDDDLAAIVQELSQSLLRSSEELEGVEVKAEAAVVQAAPEAAVEGASSIRVPVALLDNLMTLMGEMVLVRNQVLQYASRSEDLEFLSMSKRLNVVTSEIQGEMMKTRMQPIGNVLSKFNRVVRDLSQELGKTINLSITGSETELDKSLLEAIKDPLTHIVRNSCDHGIETPEIRKKSGKREAGSICVRSYHEGGQVVVEVSDDGKGLNKEILVSKAKEKGLITSAQAANLSEKEIFNLIFAPGFSTASKVTNVSGRGVGMDVVRTNIERIGGTIDLASVVGHGTTIKLKIPLTLAIVPALIVKCGSGKFAVPQVKLEELVRVDQISQQNRIEILHGTPVYRLRGNILPLVDLNSILGSQEKNARLPKSIVNIAVLNAEQFSFGLIIDEIQDTADIVVKPLTRLLKSLQVYSGATILGNGSVALILDVMGVSKVAQLKPERIKESVSSQDAENSRPQNDIQDFLLVRVNSSTRHAIALSYVHRLEEFKRSSIELSGSQRMIRYREAILPLVSANQQLGLPENGAAKKEIVPVVVIQKAGEFYGLEVDEILDTLSTDGEMRPAMVKEQGIFGNINMKNELLVVVDPFELITSLFPKSNPVPFSGASAVDTESKCVLVVEDTVFFRRSIKQILENSGYKVVTAADGQEAADIINGRGSIFDAIISDIEMPRMNGFQLASFVRSTPAFAQTPMVAVSSRADQAYMTQGVQVGFNRYLEKLKADVLIETIDELTQRRAV